MFSFVEEKPRPFGRLFGPQGAFTSAWKMVNQQRETISPATPDDPYELLKEVYSKQPAMYQMLTWILQEYSAPISFITKKSLALLSELPINEYMMVISDFIQILERRQYIYSMADDLGFLGLVSQYWNKKREGELRALLARCDSHTDDVSPTGLDETIYKAFHTFWTPSTGLEPSFIDDNCERRILQQSVRSVVFAMYEFSTAVASRTNKIRNLNAYFMAILKQNETLLLPAIQEDEYEAPLASSVFVQQIIYVNNGQQVAPIYLPQQVPSSSSSSSSSSTSSCSSFQFASSPNHQPQHPFVVSSPHATDSCLSAETVQSKEAWRI